MFGSKWADSWGEPDEPPDDCDLATWEDYKRECDEFQNAFVAMRAAVVQSIAKQCEMASLVAAVRPKAGGQMIELAQYMWNAEAVEPRFHRCDMSLDDPFETGGGSCTFYWIFIERGTLDGFLSRSDHSVPLRNQAPDSIDAAPNPNGFKQPRSHKLQFAIETLREIYPNGIPLRETQIHFFRRVGEHLRNSGKPPISEATLKRAKMQLAQSPQA
jgi:hypothetical protein